MFLSTFNLIFSNLRHVRTPNSKGCQYCKKKCLLWEKIDEKIDAEIEKIREEAKLAGIVVGEN